MTTAQESTNGHRLFPSPFSAENPEQSNFADLPTNKDNIDSNSLQSRISDLASPDGPPFPANAYHVPPKHFVPRPHAYRYDDTLGLQPETAPLPERCQFMFSDGRQCTMARSDIHSTLCRFHAEREDQLFGSPVSGGKVVGASLDLPELYSACRDLTTAAGVNRALAQVFRLLAQRRISRQEAATFGHLAQLLLRSISLARSSRESDDATSIIIPSAGESHQQDELSPGNKVHRERGISPELSRVKEVDDALRCQAEEQNVERSPEQEPRRGGVILSESSGERLPTGCAFAGQQSQRRISPGVRILPNECIDPHAQAIGSNCRTMSTYKNTEDKPIQYEHLHNNGRAASRPLRDKNTSAPRGSL